MTLGDVQSVIEPFKSFNPGGWLSVYRDVPLWLGIIFCLVGFLSLGFGGRRFFRVLAGPLIGWASLTVAPVIIEKLSISISSEETKVLAAIALCAVGVLFPRLSIFMLAGSFGGLLGGELAGRSDWPLGFLPGFLIAGAISAFTYRWVTAMLSSLVGSYFVVLGLLGALKGVGSISTHVASATWACWIAILLFAAAGTVYQLLVRLSPEERAELVAQKRRRAQRHAEQQDREKRWSQYSRNRRADT